MKTHNLYSIWLALHTTKYRGDTLTPEEKALYDNLIKKFNRQAMFQEPLK